MSNMSDMSGVGTSTGSTTGGSTGSTTDTAKNEAQQVGGQAMEGGKHVAEVGKEQAKNVTAETGQQAKELWAQTRSELLSQSAQQQDRVAAGLRSLSQELSSMVRSSEQQGVASDLASQASQRIGDVAGWLEHRDPGSLVQEVKRFARQRPGTFLAAAAAVGLVGGRLSRGLVAEHQDSTATQADSPYGQPSAGTTGVGATGVGTPSTGGAPLSVDHTTGGGYSAYGSPTDTPMVSGNGASPVTGGATEDLGTGDPLVPRHDRYDDEVTR